MALRVDPPSVVTGALLCSSLGSAVAVLLHPQRSWGLEAGKPLLDGCPHGCLGGALHGAVPSNAAASCLKLSAGPLHKLVSMSSNPRHWGCRQDYQR